MKFWMLIVISIYLHIATTTASLLPSNVQSAHAQMCYDSKGLPHDVGKFKEVVVSDSSFLTCPSCKYSRLSLSRLRLSRITAFLEEKI